MFVHSYEPHPSSVTTNEACRRGSGVRDRPYARMSCDTDHTHKNLDMELSKRATDWIVTLVSMQHDNMPNIQLDA